MTMFPVPSPTTESHAKISRTVGGTRGAAGLMGHTRENRSNLSSRGYSPQLSQPITGQPRGPSGENQLGSLNQWCGGHFAPHGLPQP